MGNIDKSFDEQMGLFGFNDSKILKIVLHKKHFLQVDVISRIQINNDFYSSAFTHVRKILHLK